jgi:hypothetical protein
MNIFNAEGSNVVDLMEEPVYGKGKESGEEGSKANT